MPQQSNEIDIDDLPSNVKFKKDHKDPQEPLEVIKPVVSKGKAKRVKKSSAKSFMQSLVSDSADNVWTYLMYDVLIPAAKSTIQDLITSGIEMFLYGDSRPSNRSRRDGRRKSIVSYNSFYDRSRPEPRERDRPLRRRSNQIDDIVIEDRGEAQDVLTGLVDMLEEYEQVSVADLYELAGIDGGSFSDHKWGWRNLRDAKIRRVNGGYLLEMPETEELED